MVSAAHKEEDIEQTLDAAERVIEKNFERK